MEKERVKYQNSTKLWATHTSIILSTTLALFLLGFVLVIGYSAYKFTNQVKESVGFKINLLSNTPDSVALAFCDTITSLDYVKSIEYISKKEAADFFMMELGEDFVSLIGENPLYPTIIVTLKAYGMNENTSRIDTFVENMSKHEYVTDVEYDKTSIHELHEFFYKVSFVLLGLVLLLLFISITLINNIIRISLYSKRLVIKTMLLVGAKKGFIMKPFILRGLRNGFLGGFISVACLSGFLYWAGQKYPEIIQLKADLHFYLLLAVTLVVLGVLISFISTSFSILKYINTKRHKLY